MLLVLVSWFEARTDTLAPRVAPSYSGNSIVNAADNSPGPLAPGAIATIYGTNLSNVTRALTGSDMSGNLLPTVLPGTGVHVLVGGLAAGIYYVSPNQINFLVPVILIPGPSQVIVTINGLAGPSIPITLAATSPAFFQLDQQTVVASHIDGSVVTADNPAHPGQIVVLYATGLGMVNPPLTNLAVATAAAQLKQLAALKITLDGNQVDASHVPYAGVCPGFAGLYQINLQLPDSVGPNPELRVALGDESSPAGLILPVQP
ncbi:MAG: hypothetical protein JO022_14510 [Acidobacteriaceae bacterium]|nr:hypothetical protein [Acidobacteriaceae bacterium]